MSFFRSEQMVLCRLILHEEYAFDCLMQLAYLGKVQFLDADSTPNNKFINAIHRCEELERVIKRLQDEINKSGMHTVFLKDADQHKPQESDLPEIERVIFNLDRELTDVQTNCDALLSRQFSLYEHMQVLEKVEIILSRNSDVKITSPDSIMHNLIQDTPGEETMDKNATNPNETGLFLVTGSIPMNRFPALELMVWRVSRGNAFVKYKEFELPNDLATRFQQRNLKYAFLIAIVGENLHQKMIKICQGFQAKVYPCASTTTERLTLWKNLRTELENLKQISDRSDEHRKRVLVAISEELFLWRAIIRKMHQVYVLMNRFGIVHEYKQDYWKYLKCDCWIPRYEMHAARKALTRGSRVSAGETYALTFPPLLIERKTDPRHPLKPPTYFRTNKFTNGFQKLIDAYGTASYREVNPAPYTIITFPFLFAVMFGDIGHGLLMALFAASLVWREEKIKRNQKYALKSNEIFDMLFAGRYIILLMGLFSMYTGFIYNDLLSKPVNIFGSSWHTNFTAEQVVNLNNVQPIDLDPSNPAHYRGTPYIFGVDPIWNSLSKNSIILNNSLKMKIAIILGVLQMIFGLTLSAWNALFFRNKIDFFLVFLPQIIFLTSLFFYLVVLIFHKWSYYGGLQVGEYSAACGPSILITFINMILLKKSDPPLAGCRETMFTGQYEIQHALLIIALLAVPVLLCGKPLHFMYQHRRIAAISDPEHAEELRHSTMNSLRRSLIYNVRFQDSDPHLKRIEPEENLSEIWIHQGIHTIESVLGSVSHTASYLRLWALSLAHSQLSDVLWQMVLSAGLKSKRGFYNSIVIFFTFAAFATLTVAILVVMEGLSAFLHTLRLHWVEFQSKYFDGLGEPFEPLRFEESRKRDSYT